MRNTFRGHDHPVESVDFSPNGRFVVSASWDQTVRIWNMRDGSTKVLTGDASIFWSVRFSPNGQCIAVGDSDGVLRIWDVHTNRLVKSWPGHGVGVSNVAFTPDGRRLLSCSNDRSAKSWDFGSLGVAQSSGDPVETGILESIGQWVRLVLSLILVPLQ